MIKDYEHLRRVVEETSFWLEFCNLVSEKLGITILSVIYIGTRHLAEIGEKQFQSEDFALRMPKGEAWAQVAKSLGTHPIPISLHDLPKAIQDGQIDGIDSPLPAIKAYNLEKIKRLVLTSHLVDCILMVKSNKTILQPEEEAALFIASKKHSVSMTFIGGRRKQVFFLNMPKLIASWNRTIVNWKGKLIPITESIFSFLRNSKVGLKRSSDFKG